MGDISETRILIVVGCLVGIFAYLLVTIPQPLLPASERETASITYPDNWESGDLLYLTETWNMTDIAVDTDETFELGGRSFNLIGYDSALNGPSIQLHEYWYEWLVFYTHEPCEWLRNTNRFVDSDFPNALMMESLDNQSITQEERFIVRWTEHSQFKMYAILSYDTGTYASWELALDAGALGLWLGVQFDQTNTTYNAWDIIGMVLFFSMPDIDPFLNAIIAVPIWLGVAYISFILLLRAVGAIFGGGGA